MTGCRDKPWRCGGELLKGPRSDDKLVSTGGILCVPASQYSLFVMIMLQVAKARLEIRKEDKRGSLI